jgi:K+-sensing histidine kinase KdpD
VTALTHSEALKTGVTVGTQLAGELPRIQCDRVQLQLQQVMLNLIVNAIQSTSDVEDGNREVHISTVPIEPEGVRVAVRDTGHGVRPESLPRLFEPFYTTKPDGMGMGLSICRSIIEAHGGRLWATRCEPRALSFSLRSPLTKSPPFVRRTCRGMKSERQRRCPSELKRLSRTHFYRQRPNHAINHPAISANPLKYKGGPPSSSATNSTS